MSRRLSGMGNPDDDYDEDYEGQGDWVGDWADDPHEAS